MTALDTSQIVPSMPMKTDQNLQLIMTTYPGFHDLPKGVKKMLVVSESFFFDDSKGGETSINSIHNDGANASHEESFVRHSNEPSPPNLLNSGMPVERGWPGSDTQRAAVAAAS